MKKDHVDEIDHCSVLRGGRWAPLAGSLRGIL
jgi:hypothetical protein